VAVRCPERCRERVGLVGVNNAGNTMQLRIIADPEDPDGVYVAKGKGSMNIGLLSQKIQVRASQTVREEFVNAFLEEMGVKDSLDQVLAAFERATEDMDLVGGFFTI
jgi:ATPase subunit of ABC transporter with duplicated ATPase domains